MRGDNFEIDEETVKSIQAECIAENKYIVYDENDKICIHIKEEHLDTWLDRYWKGSDRVDFKNWLIANKFAFIGRVTIN